MAGNPLISQGTLNRLRGSVTWSDNPSLNITAPFLGREGISLSLMGEATNFFPTLTGTATAPEPFQMVEVTVHLLKTQSFADQYKQQMESSSLLGNGVIWPDSATLSPYEILNCGIKSVRELPFNGSTPEWVLTIGGYYLVNSALWSL